MFKFLLYLMVVEVVLKNHLRGMNMEEKRRNLSWLSALIIGICVIASCVALSFGLSHFRSENVHSIAATGSASKDFESDLITWGGSFKAKSYTSKQAYQKIQKDAEIVKKYLKANGLEDNEILFSSVDIYEKYKDIYDSAGNYVGQEEDGYELSQSVNISSEKIDTVEKISRDISSLLDSGVEFTSDSPQYYYTDLDSMKLKLIEEASENARDRVNIIAKSSDAKLGKLMNSNLGVFQITARNSGTSSYSYDGAFDTSSRWKTATVTVKLEYDLK